MMDYSIIKDLIKNNAPQFGFLDAKIAAIKIEKNAQHNFRSWLDRGYAGAMTYLSNNLELRFNPQKLQPHTLSIICVKLPYLQESISELKERLAITNQAYISSYALGRDYHKTLKQQLNKFAAWINSQLLEHGLTHNYRVFTDSAPIMEVQLASQAGLGWRGKNTLLLDKTQGSMFFLGEIFTDLPLPADNPTTAHCGSCQKCLDICPTKAFVAPYVLNASKCISYLTIENPGPIPIEFRAAIGNRIYGCDDCQLFCPWNKFSQPATLPDFIIRNKLNQIDMLSLFNWSQSEFMAKMQGSPIYRIGYSAWQRNLAIGLGNSSYSSEITATLQAKLDISCRLVQEHIIWALDQQAQKKSGKSTVV